MKAVIKKEIEEALRGFVKQLAGKGSEKIVDILFSAKNVNEAKIAGKLDITINQARNILYKLSTKNIIFSIRKRDLKKGWYNYYWTLDKVKALEEIEKLEKEDIERLRQQSKIEQTKNFYVCVNGCTELSEENALQNNFLCPECGEILRLGDKNKRVNEIQTAIQAREKNLAVVRNLIETIKPKPKIVEKKVKVKKKAIKVSIKKKAKSKKKAKPKKKAKSKKKAKPKNIKKKKHKKKKVKAKLKSIKKKKVNVRSRKAMAKKKQRGPIKKRGKKSKKKR